MLPPVLVGARLLWLAHLSLLLERLSRRRVERVSLDILGTLGWLLGKMDALVVLVSVTLHPRTGDIGTLPVLLVPVRTFTRGVHLRRISGRPALPIVVHGLVL